MNTILTILAIHSFLFGIFHMMFWKELGWKKQLKKLDNTNNAVMQILNLRLIYIFIAFGVITLLFQEALLNSELGAGVLIMISLFWVGRIVEHFVFARLMNIWSAFEMGLLSAFVLGAILPVWSLL